MPPRREPTEVELYTEPYATMYPQNPEAGHCSFIEAAKVTRSTGWGLNAGHVTLVWKI